jgi:hypothetical protein
VAIQNDVVDRVHDSAVRSFRMALAESARLTINLNQSIMAAVGACLVLVLMVLTNVMDRQAAALQQIAANTASISESLKHPAQNDECHETLQLFDEWLRPDIRHGGK